MRVCLDTNVLVAAFATRGLCADVLRTLVTKHDLVIGEVTLTELRPRLALVTERLLDGRRPFRSLPECCAPGTGCSPSNARTRTN